MALLALAVAGLAVALPARADALRDAQALMAKGQGRQALEATESALEGKPRDPQLRFLKGLILNEMNRQPEAIAVFTKLTEDFPELPEPYNNLAVIYAQLRQYDKAKTALEMAIRTHPSYATAHENLGDIYARLASQAYDKALQLDSTNVVAQTKLAMIRDLMSVSAKPVAGKTTPATARPAPVQAPTTPAVKVAAAPETKPPTAAPRVPAPPPESKITPSASAPEKEKPSKPKHEVASPPQNDSEAVATAIRAWATAWSGKDVKAYLAHYASDFRTPKGRARAVWEKERHQRIDKPGSIDVSIRDLKIEIHGSDRASARFHQEYRSAGFSGTTDKSMRLVRRNGKWLITEEQVER